MIIDCHTHVAHSLTGFWRPLRYGQVTDQGRTLQVFPPSFDPPASPPEMLLAHMDYVGIDRAFLVQHHLYGDQNETVLDAVRRWPDRFVGFGYMGGFDRPDAADDIERLIERGMHGLKVEVASTRRLRPSFRFDGEVEWEIWQRLDELGRPLVLDLGTATEEDTAVLRRMLEAFQNLRILICHLGSPPKGDWRERAGLARNPHVWLDLAAAPNLSATAPTPGCTSPQASPPEYPFAEAQKLVQWAVTTFGAHKVMWGTDYPVLLRRGTYQQLLDFVRVHCEFLTAEQKGLVLGGAAEGFLAPASA